MFSSTHAVVLGLIVVSLAGLAPTAHASTISPDPSAGAPADAAGQLDVRPPGNNTTVGNAGYGILSADRGDPGNTTTIVQTLRPNLAVTNVEYRDGFALVTVVNGRPQVTRLAVTDTNSIETSGGSGEVAYQEYTVPAGRFELKVPATAERGDQTITVGVENSLYYFSDQSGGGGVLQTVGKGLLPWALGGATMLTYIVGVAYVVLAGEQTGVREAGGTV